MSQRPGRSPRGWMGWGGVEGGGDVLLGKRDIFTSAQVWLQERHKVQKKDHPEQKCGLLSRLPAHTFATLLRWIGLLLTMMHRSIFFVSLALLLSCLSFVSATATRMTTIGWTDYVPSTGQHSPLLLDSTQSALDWGDYVTDTGEIIETDESSANPTTLLLNDETQMASSASVVIDTGLTPFQKEALDAHNQYRVKHGVQGLTWSPTVAQSAQAHADKCVFAHSQGTGYGENLAWGHFSIGAAIKDWYDEIHQYNYYSPGFSMGK